MSHFSNTIENARALTVPNSRDALLHLEALTPAGPRRRCHPHFASGGAFTFGISDLLIKLTDPQLRGPAAHWEGICRECRKTLGIDDLLRVRRGHVETPVCRHGVSIREHCQPCNVALRGYDELAHEDTPIEGWQVVPFGPPQMFLAGQTMQIVAHPQRVLAGPYRLRVHVEPDLAAGPRDRAARESIYVQEIKIGQNTLALAWGEIWGWSFEEVAPEKTVFDRLLPLAGPMMNLGQTVSVSLRNGSAFAAKISIVLFGQGMDEETDRYSGALFPRSSAVAKVRGRADPGRPPPLPGHVSVRPMKVPDFFEDPMDGLALGDYSRLPPSGPKRENPLEVLIELGEELFGLDLKPGTAITYAPKSGELRSLVKAAAIVRELGRFWAPGDGAEPDPALFVPPRFEVAGVEFEVRRYEPPPPPSPRVPSDAELRALSDHASTALYLLEQQHRLEATESEETAWESASDEYP